MQRAIIVQCASLDAESDLLSLNSYLFNGWKFVAAIPLGVVGSSNVGSIANGYLSVLVIIEDNKIPDIQNL